MRKPKGSDHVCSWCKKIFEHDTFPLVSLALAIACNPTSNGEECHELVCQGCQELHRRTKCVRHTVGGWIKDARAAGKLG